MAVRVEKDGPVTTVILDRPDVRNAVDAAHAQALYDAFRDFEADDAASVGVFWGAGGVFCAGADLKFVASGGGEAYAAELQFPNDKGPMGPSRLELSKPVVAAVSGAAVAGGMELALWCDLRVCEEDAYFGVYCRRWGVPLIDGGTVRLPRLVGMGRALDLILTGRKVTAQEAHAMGLCDRVVSKGKAREAAEALAHEIARFPQLCARTDRASVHAQHTLPLRAALEQEFTRGINALSQEGTAGAGRFASGKGRGGSFDAI
jgi:enoyl-CoA hydratase